MLLTANHRHKFLMLDHFSVNSTLARLLPAALAFRYRALPVARDDGCITVAMANPADETACREIAAALNADIYPVQAEPGLIDSLLTELWPAETNLRLLLYSSDDKVRPYSAYLQKLLHAQLHGIDPTAPNSMAEVTAIGSNYDLVIFSEPDRSLLKRMLLGPSGCQAAECIPTSVLLVRQPRWPINKILLVTRGQDTVDDHAVEWLIRLVQATAARVTVLGIVLPLPAIYQRAMAHLSEGPQGWLTTDTPLGRQLAKISNRLENWNVAGVLRFREGTPDQQIRREVAFEDYDLLVIAPDPHDWWLRRLIGELVDPLLHWADRPVLIAKALPDHKK